jgi:hypothetical protein
MAKYMGITLSGQSLDFLQSGLRTNHLVEIYSAAEGTNSLIDTINTTSLYNVTNDAYGEGIVQTNRLYDSTTEITSLLVNELTNAFIDTRGTIDVSFDDGSSWSTATNNIGDTITSFTGTSSDGGTYKLKLKMTLGSDYNDSDGISRVWATTGSLITARGELCGCGTITDALSIGGSTTSNIENDHCEIWNGTAWSSTGALPRGQRVLAGCGTTSAALSFGGNSTEGKSSHTNIWAGSSWATTTALTLARLGLGGCGTTAAALAFGGDSGANVNRTDKWNGSTWATTGVISRSDRLLSGCGTTTSALNFGGLGDGTITDIWSGSTWATTTSKNYDTYGHGGCGTASDALSILSTSEIWNGSTWTTTSSSTCPRYLASCGITSAALSFGGDFVATTEKWLGVGTQKGFSVKIN